MTTALLATGLLLASNAVLATVITFDNTASAGNFTPFWTNGSYTELGFTLTATGDTELHTFDPAYSPIATPPHKMILILAFLTLRQNLFA